MNETVGIIGDFNPQNPTHAATNRALHDVGLRPEWVATTDLQGEPEPRLADFAGVWIAPASPYRNMDGALQTIRYARERSVPLVGT
jgi:CTP synthase (UTP-ammonia lyase)